MGFNAFVRPVLYDGEVMRTLFMCFGFAALLALAPASARAQEATFTITINDHKFSQTELNVPANKRITLTVINDDPTPEEFDSKALKVEKVIPGKPKGVVRFGPLKPGKY